jgi:hypothetical protein
LVFSFINAESIKGVAVGEFKDILVGLEVGNVEPIVESRYERRLFFIHIIAANY